MSIYQKLRTEKMLHLALTTNNKKITNRNRWKYQNGLNNETI